MVLLGQLGNQRACQAFVDYLSTKQINCQLIKDKESHQIQIYVEQDQFEQANLYFSEFLQNPNQEKYLQASWQTNRPATTSNTNWGLTAIWQSTGWFTRTITLLCIVIYSASVFGLFPYIFNNLSFNFALTEPYRLITPAIMHLSALHLAFNMSWWWYLAGNVERNFGVAKLVNIFLLTALISNVCQAILVNNQFAGLSGVNYGLAGFVWLYGRMHPNSDVVLPNNIFIFFIAWMALGFVDLLPINMANWAHLCGLLTGLLLAQLTTKKGA